MTALKRAYGTAKEPVRHATVSNVGTQHVFSCAIYTSLWSYGFYFSDFILSNYITVRNV